jgi:3-hydroxyacyl-CoA dehydrogenase
LKKGVLTQADLEKKLGRAKVTTKLDDLFDCDLVIEARMESRDIKAEFYRALAPGMKPDAVVASNSSSMGPGLLGGFFAEGGGSTKNFVNLHFFSPAEHPMMQLVEVIRGKDTTDDAVATAHAFVRSINKTPVILNDGSPGFLVNAGLAAYMLEAERDLPRGHPSKRSDQAMRGRSSRWGRSSSVTRRVSTSPRGMFDTIAAATPIDPPPLVWKLAKAKRFRREERGGISDYADGKKGAEWSGLAGLVQNRGSRVAPAEEIVERCARALYKKARELCDRKIVGSEEECDQAFVFGIGFAMYLGGPIFYGKQRGWA